LLRVLVMLVEQLALVELLLLLLFENPSDQV
jgi:hypothetical protein